MCRSEAVNHSFCDLLYIKVFSLFTLGNSGVVFVITDNSLMQGVLTHFVQKYSISGYLRCFISSNLGILLQLAGSNPPVLYL